MTSTNRNDDASNNNIMKKYEMIRSREELRDDIHTSFDYAMRYAVYTRASDNDDDDASLSAERAATLYEWLHLLRKTLPISYTTLHQCIKSLIDHHDYVKRSELYMVSILDEYAPPKHAVWSTSCSYGMMDTGYTCGLWLLLHTITVGVVDYNRNVAFPQHRLSTETVAVTIRNYINTFFGCEICRQNFVSTFDSCGHDRCHRLHSDISHNEHDWIQLPLWLLETHNAVNVRLLQEQGQRDNTTVTDNDVISAIWPLSRDCPKCWLNANGSTPTTIPINKRNDDIMYKFLKVVYGQQDALYIKYQEQIQADVKEVMSTERSNAPVTNNNDVNFNTTGNSKLLDHIVAAMPSLQFHLGMIPMLDSREVATHRFIVRELMEKVFVNNNGDDPKLLDQSVTNTKSTALMEWLMLLRKTLPVVWHGVHSLIDELLNNWSYVCKSKDYLFAIVSEHPPPSNDIKKGFILPLLLEISNDDEAMDYLDVLHIISVGVVQYNKYMVSSDDQRLSTFNVIDTIRKYTSQVFDGSSIESTEAQHTVQESMDDVCENDSICDTFSESPKNEQDWISLPMWTVKVHNTVLQQRETTTANHRLLSLVAARKHLFPRSVECPKCWIYDGSLRWDDDYVYKYLLLLYGPESTLGVGLRFEFFGPPLWETFVGALQNSLKHLTLPIFQPDKYKLH